MNIRNLFFLAFAMIIVCRSAGLTAQTIQINVPRISLMPDQPAPYNLRNWKSVALKYDSFVYNVQKTGQYLPLVNIQGSGINYPDMAAYGLHTYVGTNSPAGNEAINVMPSLVGATLCGIDKTSQFGRNWVTMSRDFFSGNDNQQIYLNNKGGGSGADWWYDVMPNVYFYQLYNLHTPDQISRSQFVKIADQFLASVKVLGGSDTPWNKGNFDYRGFNFKTMQPNPNGVREPEAAGAYAWILYMAFRETGNNAYLRGAEWALEFLDAWNTNPSYELMLPYGTYVAARMNAELGTKYNVEKMVNWSFEKGPLRNWGTIVGKWGGFDVSGLVGEANGSGNDYAFQLNGVQQMAALVPMVRYDKRFAKSIGKWALNLVNATRLFYPGFLPAGYQDNASWSAANDPDRVMGYEALREKYQGISPYSTGDAIAGGWAKTNLSLYSTGSIGYLGSMVSNTETEKILLIDVLKTDFFKSESYPTYLIYNPYGESRKITLPVGNGNMNIYDAISESYMATDVSQNAEIIIPGNTALLVSICPAEGNVTYDRNRMLIDGVIVDYNQTKKAWNRPPRIQSVAAESYTVEKGQEVRLFAQVQKGDAALTTYSWKVNEGTLLPGNTTAVYTAPGSIGKDTVTFEIADAGNLRDTAMVILNIVDVINRAPVIENLQMQKVYVATEETIEIVCDATDFNADPLQYTWNFNGGIASFSGNTAVWTAPAIEGIIEFTCIVKDDKGLSTSAEGKILVRNFDDNTNEKLIAYYNLNGTANDQTTNLLHGIPFNTAYVPDATGSTQRAMYFNGVNGRVSISNNTVLNFQDGITVSFWVKANDLPAKETFAVSHGSWQTRWKVSFTPDARLRWTINTATGIMDLDMPQSFVRDSFYHISCTYDQKLAAIYVDGILKAFRQHTGKLNTTTHALLLGQMLPGNTEYNFKGVLDEVRIYNNAVNPAGAEKLYNQLTKTYQISGKKEQLTVSPNPAADYLNIQTPAEISEVYDYSIYDSNGLRCMYGKLSPGSQTLSIAGLPSGYYILDLIGRDFTQTQHFVVVR